MPVKTFPLFLTSSGNAEVHEITDQVARHVSQSSLENGTATIFCPSSTSGVTPIEYASGAVSDLKRLFDKIAPPNRDYAHSARWAMATVTAISALAHGSKSSTWISTISRAKENWSYRSSGNNHFNLGAHQ